MFFDESSLNLYTPINKDKLNKKMTVERVPNVWDTKNHSATITKIVLIYIEQESSIFYS